MSERLWREYRAHLESLLPVRGEASPEAMRLLREASDWTRKKHVAEQALFMAENGTPGVVGAHGEYQWLSMIDCDISTLVRLCPDVVLGKYLAITSIDNDMLHLTDQERAEGWWTPDVAKVFTGTSWSSPQYHNDCRVAYSPRLTSIHGLPNETHDEYRGGFNEWYVFEQPVPPGEMEVFVNWGGFRLNNPDYQWCADRLWEQLARLAPESYIADGTVFTFATRNKGLFTSVLAAFAAKAE
jgi:hypothetical protein